MEFKKERSRRARLLVLNRCMAGNKYCTAESTNQITAYRVRWTTQSMTIGVWTCCSKSAP